MDRRLIFKVLATALARTATANGSTVDLQALLEPAKKEIAVILQCGAMSGTLVTLNVHLESSPDASTWTDIPGAAFTEQGDVGEQTLWVKPPARYIREVHTLGGTSPNFTFAVIAAAIQLQS